ncbi:MAG TPA: GNAT family N-acetyltransferase [Opitutaceae bacterium]|nr:GNAT family N-acetyltransferase [Opitutaceae bacterium]
MAIRLLGKNDVSPYRRLRLQGLRESPTAFGSSHQQEGKQPLRFFEQRIVATPERWALGAFAGEKLVGVIGFVRDAGLKNRHKGFIWGMYVAPRFRRRGIGLALFRAALARVEALRGLRWVRLSVTTSNRAALRLYRKLGFVRYAKEPESLFVNGRYYPEYHLVLRLGRKSGR